MGNHKRNKSKNRSNTRKNHILQVQNKEDATSNINYEQLNYMESHIKALYQKYLVCIISVEFFIYSFQNFINPI